MNWSASLPHNLDANVPNAYAILEFTLTLKANINGLVIEMLQVNQDQMDIYNYDNMFNFESGARFPCSRGLTGGGQPNPITCVYI